jgi:RNA polymerase sigma-70 factor (ECF subfamily)
MLSIKRMGLQAEEIERLYRASYTKFVNVLASATGSYESGRDATQEAFARALAARGQFRGEGSVEGWVWRIALRVARERWARSDGARRLDDSDLPDVELVLPERDPALTEALKELSERRRLFVFLRYFADLSYAEIAEVCGVAEGTVSAALVQSREALGRQLSQEGAVR